MQNKKLKFSNCLLQKMITIWERNVTKAFLVLCDIDPDPIYNLEKNPIYFLIFSFQNIILKTIIYFNCELFIHVY